MEDLPATLGSRSPRSDPEEPTTNRSMQHNDIGATTAEASDAPEPTAHGIGHQPPGERSRKGLLPSVGIFSQLDLSAGQLQLLVHELRHCGDNPVVWQARHQRWIRPEGTYPPPCPGCGGDLEWRHREWPDSDERCRNCWMQPGQKQLFRTNSLEPEPG